MHRFLCCAVASCSLIAGMPSTWAQPAPSGEPATAPLPLTTSPAPAAPAPASALPAPAAAPPAPATGWVPRPRALPAEPPAAPAPRTSWRPFGYLRLVGSLVQDDPDVAFIGRADGFDLQNLRAGVRGQLARRAAFELSLDGAVDERDHLNAPQGRLRLGLRDAFVDLPLGGGLAVRAGRFEAVFAPDVRDGDTERAFIDRALEIRGVLATEGWQANGLTPGRSLGVALELTRGEPLQRGIALELAAQNGADELSSSNDNDALALSVAARAYSAPHGWVQLAARYNPRTEGELPFRQEETDLALALGAGGAWGPIEASAGGVLVHTTFSTTGGNAQRALGVHGQLLWRAEVRGLPLRAGYRFALLDSSSLVVTDRVLEHTAGATLGLPALQARLQLGVVHVAEQAARTLTNDRVEAALEVSL